MNKPRRGPGPFAPLGEGTGLLQSLKQGGAGLKHIVPIGRLLFGGWFLVSGVNHWLKLLPVPLGSTNVARHFFEALIASRLYDVVKVIEVVAGILLIANRYTPLMLAACLPLSVVIFYWDVVLDRDRVELIFGPLALLINGLLILSYFNYFKPLLTFRAIVSIGNAEVD